MLIFGQNCLGLAQINDDVAIDIALDLANHEFAAPFVEFDIHVVALHIADALQNYLLSRLGGNPTKIAGRGFNHNLVELLNTWVDFAGVINTNFEPRVFDFVDHQQLGIDVGVAFDGVDFDTYIHYWRTVAE